MKTRASPSGAPAQRARVRPEAILFVVTCATRGGAHRATSRVLVRIRMGELRRGTRQASPAPPETSTVDDDTRGSCCSHVVGLMRPDDAAVLARTKQRRAD